MIIPLRLIALCGLLWAWSTGEAKGQGQNFARSALTASLEPVADLHGVWMDENDQPVTVPFIGFERGNLEIHRTVGFSRNDSPCFLYFEGLAWTAEVYFNGHLLTITDDPFAEHLLPLSKEQIRPGANEVRVRLNMEGRDLPLYPRPFLGMFRQAAVLRVADNPPAWTPVRTVAPTGRAVVVAPWGEGEQLLDDLGVIESSLDGLFAYPGADPVFFPFRPSSRSQEFLADRGIPVALTLQPTDSVAFYNPYPVEEQPLRQNVNFWRRSDGRPAAGYGQLATLNQLRTPAVSSPNQLALLVLLLAPVLALLLMKLGTPRIYSSMLEFLTKTKIYLELIANNKFLKSQQRWLLNLLRLLLVAVGLSLFIYFLAQTGRLKALNLVTPESYLYRILTQNVYSLYHLFLGFLVLLVAGNLTKYFLLNISGGIYRVGWLSVMSQNLDIFASLPLILLTLLPAPFIFFLDPQTGQIVLTVWYGLFLVYFLRRIVLIYIGLTRLFSFSPGLKILYICTLEILPWIILL